MIGIVRYGCCLIKISSKLLKTVYRGETLYKIPGLPSGIEALISPDQTSVPVPVISRDVINMALDKVLESNNPNSSIDSKEASQIHIGTKKKTHSQSGKFLAYIFLKEDPFAFPVDELLRVADESESSIVHLQKEKYQKLNTIDFDELLPLVYSTLALVAKSGGLNEV